MNRPARIVGAARLVWTICPTQAIVAPYRVDARRCISYHTIELHGPIPLEFRRAIGNRIYGCDDCQLACPWNRFAQPSAEPDFRARHGLDAPNLIALFGWDEAEFLRRTEGSAIRRIGHERWLRNIAVALGNAPHSPEIISALQAQAGAMRRNWCGSMSPGRWPSRALLLITDPIIFKATFQRRQRDAEFPGDRRLVMPIPFHRLDNHLPLHLP